MNDEKQWLIFEARDRLWWKPDANGYTVHRAEAGRYTEEEARRAQQSAAATSERKDYALHVDDLDCIRHMLGVSERSRRGYRNYFVAGGKDVDAMERLRAAGLVVKNERHAASADACYHATLEGAKVIGLKALPK